MYPRNSDDGYLTKRMETTQFTALESHLNELPTEPKTMTIDEAIESLKRAKNGGTKNIIIAWWEADMFARNDDEEWEYCAHFVDQKMDWSTTHDAISELIHVCTACTE